MTHRKKQSRDTTPQQQLNGASDGALALQKAQRAELRHLATSIRRHHNRCRRSGVQFSQHAISAGDALNQAGAKIRHGGFTRWVEATFCKVRGLSIKSAQRYMALADDFREFLQSRGVDVGEGLSLSAYCTEQAVEAFLATRKTPPSMLVIEANTDQTATPLSITVAPVATIEADPNIWATPNYMLRRVKTVLRSIDTDPCALSIPLKRPLAELNLRREDDGLADHQAWMDATYVNPGDKCHPTAWIEKALQEKQRGTLKSAILWLPVSALNDVIDLKSYPFAVTPKPLTVARYETGVWKRRTLSCRSVFVLIPGDPDQVRLFAAEFGEIAAVFVPSDCSRP